MKFLDDVEGFRHELNDRGNKGWTAFCLNDMWHIEQNHDMFKE